MKKKKTNVREAKNREKSRPSFESDNDIDRAEGRVRVRFSCPRLSARAAPNVGRRDAFLSDAEERNGNGKARRVAPRCVAVFNYFYHGLDMCEQKIKFSPTEHMATFSIIKVDRPKGNFLFDVITFPIRGKRYVQL